VQWAGFEASQTEFVGKLSKTNECSLERDHVEASASKTPSITIEMKEEHSTGLEEVGQRLKKVK